MPDIHPIIEKIENPPNTEPILEDIMQNEIVADVSDDIQNENLIELTANGIDDLQKTFCSLLTENIDDHFVSGFIERLSEDQRAAFDKIVDKKNKKIILIGKAGTGIFSTIF